MAKKKNTSNTDEPSPILASVDDPHRLSSEIIRDFWRGNSDTRIRFWSDDWFTWTGQKYVRRSDSEIRARITQQLRSILDRAAAAAEKSKEDDDSDKPKYRLKVTGSLVSDVLQAMKGDVLIPSSVEPPAWLEFPQIPQHPRLIAFRNGLLDVDGLLQGRAEVLKTHSERWFSEVCLTYEYQAVAACARWLTFLNEVLEGDADRMKLLQEFFAYCLLLPSPSRHKFLVLVGDGANGKSVILEILTAVLGEDNVSNVPLELFGARFQLTSTLGKLANIAPEVSDLDRLAEGALKAMTAGDRMLFDRKNRAPICVRATAKLILSTNNLPRFADRSDGIWRRALVLPFRVSIPSDRQNPRLTDELKEELPGILNWCADGARRLILQGLFTEPPICREALDQHRTDSNPARQFLLDRYEFRRGSQLECGETYSSYRYYCEAEGRQALDASHFSREVTRVFPEVHTARLSGKAGQPRPRVFVGLAHKAEPTQHASPVLIPRHRKL